MGSFHRNEEEDETSNEMESESVMLEMGEEDTGLTTVFAQARAERCQVFCPSSVTHGLLLPQNVAHFQQTRPKTYREASGKKNGRCRRKRRVPIEKPSTVSPGILRFDVSCCSDIYTSLGRSAEVISQLESMYIYAESIKGYDTSCSGVSQRPGSLCFDTETEETCRFTKNPRLKTPEIASSIEALFGSDSSWESESIGGDYESDSSCIDADWEQSFDSDNDSSRFTSRLAKAHWGSASFSSSSAASTFITNNDLDSSTTEQHGNCAIGGYFEAGPTDSPAGQCEAMHCDSAVNHFEDRYHDLSVSHYRSRQHCQPPEHSEAGHCDLSVGHLYEKQTDAPVSHFYTGICDSPVGYFHTGALDSLMNQFGPGHCDSSVSHFEKGYCNSMVSHFVAGDHDLSDDHPNVASCDLYNAFSESSDTDYNNHCSSELTWRKLPGVVTHSDGYPVASFFHEILKETEHERNREKGTTNKGLLFHPQRAKDSKYREGQEYSMLRHIQNGAYGDVFSVRDKQTGFTCAAKKIPLSSFSWEEVGTWSRLDLPRVLQLYGAVQEGLNVILFMDLKTGSLAQFLKQSGHFPEDVALYYHCQVLQALEHLHSRKVIHLDVKVDNVLLSVDKRECFLCDFGLSEMLDLSGHSTKTFRGNGLRGTESHMSPEVARGDPRSDKADVWSSCCMLLHMLSGHQPWTRYYTHPLCLKIVSEPAPLWEIPSGCDPFTCDVIRGGLVKEPEERDSARQLLEKSSRALRAVGNLFNPAQSDPKTQISPPVPPHNVLPKPLMALSTGSIKTTPIQKEPSTPRIQWVSRWRERAAEEDGTDSEDSDGRMGRTEMWAEKYWGLRNENIFSENENDTHTDKEMQHSSEERWRFRAGVKEKSEQEGVSSEEIESDLGSLREFGSEGEWEPLHRLEILFGSNRRHTGDGCIEMEEECLTTSADLSERNSRLSFTCHRSACRNSDDELTGKGSEWSDDLSSGVFSLYSSATEDSSFNIDWSVSTNQPPSCSFEGLGVDIWVEDVTGETFRIRERPRVKLGHVARGISAQISIRAFCLATLDGKKVSPNTEVFDSRTWLLCVPAPDHSTEWTWRIRDGKMEMQEADFLQSDTCSTLEA